MSKFIIVYTKGKHRNKYIKESPDNLYWDEVSRDYATQYKNLEIVDNKIMELCARVGDELYLKAINLI